MSKAIECAKKIKKDISADWSELLEDNGLHIIFGHVYNALPTVTIENKNRIICYIIYAYDPESGWIELNKDRTVNKKTILENIGANSNEEIFCEIINNQNQIVAMCTFNFLESLKDWRWRMIYDLLEWASNNQQRASQQTATITTTITEGKDGDKSKSTEEIDIEAILKADKLKGMLLDEAMSKRRKADDLLNEIRKDFVHTDAGTQSDFGFKFSDTAKKKDIMSWRHYIREKNTKLQTA